MYRFKCIAESRFGVARKLKSSELMVFYKIYSRIDMGGFASFMELPSFEASTSPLQNKWLGTHVIA
jgi:hypothetical protein